jgi:hypothetical protein
MSTASSTAARIGIVATTGVVGQRWRATVRPDGCVEPHDGSAPLRWHVAADDRWHDPNSDAAVRHGRVAGTAVFETKLRVPGGDAVQQVWSVADRGGYTLVSVHNDSPRPFAVAFTRSDLATSRPPADIPITGLELPPGSIVLPVGHRTAVTVGLAHADPRPATLPPGLPADDAVVRGWIARTDVASRLDLPERSLVEAVRAARCELLLRGLDDVSGDPERHLLGLSELLRLEELDRRDAIAAAPDVAAAVDAIARRPYPLGRAALAAAGVVLAAAGERRALDDLAAVDAALDSRASNEPSYSDAIDAVDDVATIAIVERRLAAGARLFPDGIPARWRGHDFEAHGLVAAPASRLSLAVRWHGANAAVLWDVEGEPLRLFASVGSSPWSAAAPRGEALWQLADG